MDEKIAYQEKIEAQLKQTTAKIAELAAKADQAKAETKIHYQEQIRTLNAKREEMNRRLIRLREAGDDAWEEIKKGIEDAWNDLKYALDSAVSKFK